MRFFYTYETEVPEKEQILEYIDDLIYTALTRQREDKEKERKREEMMESEDYDEEDEDFDYEDDGEPLSLENLSEVLQGMMGALGMDPGTDFD